MDLVKKVLSRLNIFNKSYPVPKKGLPSLGTAIFFGFFIAGFLIFFKPFGLNLQRENFDDLKISFFGIISAVAVLVFYNFLPVIFPKIFSDKFWKVKHQLFFFVFMLFCIATFNGLYINYIFDYPFLWENYKEIIWQTISLGIIPICIYILFNYNNQLQKYLKEAKNIDSLMDKTDLKENNKVFEIKTDLKNDTFIVDEESFLFAQADGNYTNIFCKDNKRNMLRISLNSLETQLLSKNLFRCHRSFLVNLKQVERVEGNAQGLKLWLQENAFVVPVSRKYIPSIKATLEQEKA